MFDFIRNIPDSGMMLVIMGIGMLGWVIWLSLFCGIPYLCKKLKYTITVKYIKLQQENKRLRKYISKLRKELIRENIR